MDDRRRFRELWKELLLARAAGSVVGTIVFFLGFGLVVFIWGRDPNAKSVLALGIFAAVGLGIPSSIAKRGKTAGPLVALATFLAGAGLVASFVASGTYWPDDIALPVTLGCTIGAVEGSLERSWASLLTGILGGTVSGLFFATYCPSYHHVDDIEVDFAFVAILHLGIGLSLALGRWIRDWPKRPAARAGDNPAPPGA